MMAGIVAVDAFLLYSVCFPPVSGEGGSLCGDQAAEYIPEYRIGNILPDRLPVAV